MTEYFLFSNPSFISGMSRVLDLGSTLNEYNSTLTSNMADYLAISSDWEVVGKDLREAVKSYKENLDSEK